MSGHRFLGYVQNHDQVGNRAMGRRLSQLVDIQRLKMASALVLTSPFVPMLFMGEEWGASTPFLYFADHLEPGLAKAVREGRRNEFAAFGWQPEDIPDPQALETFKRSKLNWSELETPPHRELQEWYRQLIQLRRSEPSLADGRLDLVQTQLGETERWLVLKRGSITIACNFGESEQLVPIGLAKHKVLLATQNVSTPTASTALFSRAGLVILKVV